MTSRGEPTSNRGRRRASSNPTPAARPDPPPLPAVEEPIGADYPSPSWPALRQDNAPAQARQGEPVGSRSSLVHGKYVIIRAGDDIESSTVISDGAIFQRDGIIEDVGPYAELRQRYQPDETIGGPNYVVFPGLINSHHHGRGLTTLQMGTLDDALESWIIDGLARRPVDYYLINLYTALQMIESGTTTVMYNHMLTPAATREADAKEALRALSSAGMRVGFSVFHRAQNRIVYQDDQTFISSLPTELGNTVRRYLDEVAISDDDYFDLFRRTYDQYGSDPNSKVRVLLSPANAHWASDEFLQRTKELAQQYKTGIHMHLVESHYQKLYGTRTWNKTPLGHLKDLEFLGPEVSYAHGVWLTESNLQLLSIYGGSVCHNASSNLRLKNGIAPVNRMLRYGVNVAIGTDSDGINDDDDMVQEMRLVSKLHRQPGITSPTINNAQVLKMATVNGASPAFFGDQVGSLEIGRRADVVLMDLAHIEEPYMDPDIHIIDALLYRGKARHVDTVLIDGEVVLRDGRFTRFDKSDVMAQLKESLAGPPPEHVARIKRMARELAPYVQEFYRSWVHQEAPSHYRLNSRI